MNYHNSWPHDEPIIHQSLSVYSLYRVAVALLDAATAVSKSNIYKGAIKFEIRNGVATCTGYDGNRAYLCEVCPSGDPHFEGAKDCVIYVDGVLFHKLIKKLHDDNKDWRVSLHVQPYSDGKGDNVLHIAAGRTRYFLVPVRDLGEKEKANYDASKNAPLNRSFTMPQITLWRLLKRASVFMDSGKNNPMSGVRLRDWNGKLMAVGTTGNAMSYCKCDLPAGAKGLDIMLPCPVVRRMLVKGGLESKETEYTPDSVDIKFNETHAEFEFGLHTIFAAGKDLTDLNNYDRLIDADKADFLVIDGADLNTVMMRFVAGATDKKAHVDFKYNHFQVDMSMGKGKTMATEALGCEPLTDSRKPFKLYPGNLVKIGGVDKKADLIMARQFEHPVMVFTPKNDPNTCYMTRILD